MGNPRSRECSCTFNFSFAAVEQYRCRHLWVSGAIPLPFLEMECEAGSRNASCPKCSLQCAPPLRLFLTLHSSFTHTCSSYRRREQGQVLVGGGVRVRNRCSCRLCPGFLWCGPLIPSPNLSLLSSCSTMGYPEHRRTAAR